MRSIAQRIMSSEAPSASAVANEVRRVMAAVAGDPVQVRDASTGTTWEIANPSDHDWTRALWAFQFGASGTTHVLVWSNSSDDALEEAADYLLESGEPGHFVPDDIMEQHYAEAREELGEGATDEAVAEKAEADLDHTEAGWIPSWEWTVNEASPELTKLAKSASAAAGQEGEELDQDVDGFLDEAENLDVRADEQA